jgi:hypothetical protein
MVCRCCKLAGNCLRLGEVAEIEAQMFSFAQKYEKEPKLQTLRHRPLFILVL